MTNLYESLKNKISKNKFFKIKLIKDKSFYEELLIKKKYDLIINCDSNNFLQRNILQKKLIKITIILLTQQF